MHRMAPVNLEYAIWDLIQENIELELRNLDLKKTIDEVDSIVDTLEEVIDSDNIWHSLKVTLVIVKN